MNSALFFALTIIPERRACTLCREIQPCGLVGTMKIPGQTEKVLCDRCFLFECQPLGLTLQGVRLMQQVAAFRLSGSGICENQLCDSLLQFWSHLELSTRSAWPRHYPQAKIYCEHCLLSAFPDLEKTQADLLRSMFHHYQRFRFRTQTSRDLYFVRFIEFKNFSEEMKAAAFDRLESFIEGMDENELCPGADTELRLLGQPFHSQIQRWETARLCSQSHE